MQRSFPNLFAFFAKNRNDIFRAFPPCFLPTATISVETKIIALFKFEFGNFSVLGGNEREMWQKRALHQIMEIDNLTDFPF